MFRINDFFSCTLLQEHLSIQFLNQNYNKIFTSIYLYVGGDEVQPGRRERDWYEHRRHEEARTLSHSSRGGGARRVSVLSINQSILYLSVGPSIYLSFYLSIYLSSSPAADSFFSRRGSQKMDITYVNIFKGLNADSGCTYS